MAAPLMGWGDGIEPRILRSRFHRVATAQWLVH